MDNNWCQETFAKYRTVKCECWPVARLTARNQAFARKYGRSRAPIKDFYLVTERRYCFRASICLMESTSSSIFTCFFYFFYILEWMRLQFKKKERRKNSVAPASAVNIGGSSAIIEQRFHARRWWMWPATGIDGLSATNYSDAASVPRGWQRFVKPNCANGRSSLSPHVCLLGSDFLFFSLSLSLPISIHH